MTALHCVIDTERNHRAGGRRGGPLEKVVVWRPKLGQLASYLPQAGQARLKVDCGGYSDLCPV